MNRDQIKQAGSISAAIVTLQGNKAFHTPRISKRLDELIEIQKRIKVLSVDQGVFSSYRRGGKTLEYLRDRLRKEHINPLSADGKLYLEGQPGIEDSLRLPSLRAADSKLIEGARRIIKNVTPFKDTFVLQGYQPDFLEQAERAVDELERASSQPPTIVTKRSLATRELPEVIGRGRKILQAINRLVDADLRDDKLHRKIWKDSYRLPGIMGRPKKRSRKKEPPRN